MKFRRKQLVRHLKTGGVYRIEETPDRMMIEATTTPAYAYRLCHTNASVPSNFKPTYGARIWVRPQAEMEDGRFEAVDA
jgi:hypothetical protein